MVRRPATTRIAVLAAVTAVAAITGLLVAQQNSEAGRVAQVPQLSCLGGNQESTDLDFALPPAPAKTSPEALPDRWARIQGSWAIGQGGQVERRWLYRSDVRAQIGYVAPDGRLVAVLTMADNPRMGWYIESVDECA